MANRSHQNQCIFQVFDGLREGLSRFSRASRVALIYAVDPEDPPRIYDPQGLLEGHEPKLREVYSNRDIRRDRGCDLRKLRRLEVRHEPDPGLAGLISFGGRSRSVAYQMWFTEHHPDLCHTGPVERWLEHAVWLLAQDMGHEEAPCIGTSGYVLREYATHAVRDHIVDGRNAVIGWDTQIRIYPTLDAILGISETVEEGAWPRGDLVFVEPSYISRIRFIARFPYMERPSLKNHKHVRKLLLSVENSDRMLVSDGKTILGVAAGPPPPASVVADFRGGHGFLRLDDSLICSFFDGRSISDGSLGDLQKSTSPGATSCTRRIGARPEPGDECNSSLPGIPVWAFLQISFLANLETSSETDFPGPWVAEAERRLEDLRRGNATEASAKEVLRRVRSRISCPD
jgi:hypothetical protein